MKFARVRVLIVSLVAVLGATAIGAGFAVNGETDSAGKNVVAQFKTAAPLVTGNQIKYHGVVVGEVLAMTPRGGHADVLMHLNPSALPLHEDAHATIRPVSLLGERFIDLDRGSPQAPSLRPGLPIRQENTGTNVDLDQILNVFNEPTSRDLANLVNTLGNGAQGNGANTQALIAQLSPALRDTRALTEVLHQHNDLLNGLVQQTEPIAGALATDHGRSVDQIVSASDRLLAATSAQQHQLDATLAELPGALNSARGALNNLNGAARQTTPMLNGLRPATDRLGAISDELTHFSDSLDPALATAQPVLQRADGLLDQARPVAAQLRAAGPGLRSSAASAQPITQAATANLDNVFHFIRYWALATNGHDGLSHYFRVNLIVDPAAATGQLPGAVQPPAGAGPMPPPASVPGQPILPMPGGKPAAPGLPGLPALPGLLQPPPGAPAQQSINSGATGLDPRQEHNMMSYLLGGGS